MYVYTVHPNPAAGIYLALCFALVHDTPRTSPRRRVQKRQNELYMSGKISLTSATPPGVPYTCAGHLPTPRTSATTANRSTGRNGARPVAMTTNGSAGRRSVQLVGIEWKRPFESWKVTRSSPQVFFRVRNANRWPRSG